MTLLARPTSYPPPGAPGFGDGVTEPPGQSDEQLLSALRRGEEEAFLELVNRYYNPLLRLAQLYLSNRALAEEVVQETWLGVLRGLEKFEGRSSLKTWIFSILINRAKTQRQREARSIPFSSRWNSDAEDDEPAVDPERFLPAEHARWPHHWAVPPRSWGAMAEKRLLTNETLAHVGRAIAALPPAQREVITLRDVEGWTSEEVCNALALSESNQRVLLHRARSRVRRALESHMSKERFTE